MAGDLDPVGLDRATGRAPVEPDTVAPDQRPSRQGPNGLIERIARAQCEPPVGLLLIGWDRPEARSGPDETYRRLVEESVAFAVDASTARADQVVAAAGTELAIIRTALAGPATAEGLAHRLARRLDVELDRLAITADEPAARWAIGVAVGRAQDRAADLLRYAETALDDAWLLGGRRLVAFDDGDRELLDRPATED